MERGDTVARHLDVDRPHRRGAGAVYDGRAGDEQCWEGSFAFARGAIGHALHLRLRGDGRRDGKREECGKQADRRHGQVSPSTGLWPSATGGTSGFSDA